ncbi:HBR063Cp [Eremothecium sinecaudum]|uniref:HBR063Cp n=1 Tax=Eremothecium sinecaudum TaxID=45286 RepID=A0A120K127_9SACH|nr:HBR063Cp [Eremothecium sinecaudum]AMD18964.1 HBR063Cp [Eremothecium sinecaudum]
MVKTDLRSSRSEATQGISGSWSRSGSRTRRPSLPRNRSSQRLIRTISLEGKSAEASNTQADTSGDEPLQFSDAHELQEHIEVPFVKATLDASLPMEYLKVDVLNLVISLKVPKWYKTRNLNANDIKITMITGSMTNAIFKIEHSKLPSLLLRVYGPNVTNIIDRNYELQTLARLSMHHIGPSLYGCFTNGRFEQFLENSKTLTKECIRNWETSRRIARRMKEFHSGVPLLPWEKDHCMSWSRIEKWVDTIESSEWVKDPANLISTLLIDNWAKFKKIIMLYKDWLKSRGQFKKPFHFCHNDAQYGNLLFTSPVIPPASDGNSVSMESPVSVSLLPSDSNISLVDIIHPSVQEQAQDSKLVVIDFEYAGPNPVAFDLANHLSEWMSDYHSSDPYKTFEENYPTKEEILNFVYSYVSHLRPSKNCSVDEEVRVLYNDIIQWRPCVALHWGLWGIIQSGALDAADKASSVVVEEGPCGEKYIITVDEEALDSDGENGVINNDESPTVQGADIHSFDYLSYAREKFNLFYGDLIELQAISENEVYPNTQLKKLDTSFL